MGTVKDSIHLAKKLVIPMIHKPEPHLEAADSELLLDTILHHENLIAQHMELAAGRHVLAGQAEPDLRPEEIHDLENRFVFVLEVACELASRTGG